MIFKVLLSLITIFIQTQMTNKKKNNDLKCKFIEIIVYGEYEMVFINVQTVQLNGVNAWNSTAHLLKKNINIDL